MRIVSLVPSLTELLINLGLENELVGRTKFCIHPADKVKSIPKIGGTKNVRISAVKALNPDLIIANKEENTKGDVELLRDISNVHLTDITNFSDALDSIIQIGILTNREEETHVLVNKIKNKFAKLDIPGNTQKSVCYLIWKDPLMTIGNDTYIHDMLNKSGFHNAFGDQTRYPIISAKDIQKVKPAYIFLSSEPFPFKEEHLAEFSTLFPSSKVVIVDGEYFSWYGSRMVAAADYFINLVKGLN